MKVQADLFEKSIRLMREPTELAKAAAGVEKQPRKKASGGASKSGGGRKKKGS